MKKVIIAIIAIILILIIILGVIFLINSKEKVNGNEETKGTINSGEPIKNKIEKVTNRDMFFTVASCVEKYLNMTTKKENEKLYNLLYDEYKDEFKITTENIQNYVDYHQEYQIFKAKQMYKLEQYSNNKYFVYGKIKDDTEYSSNKETDYYITVIMDPMNKTFSIMPNGFMFSNDLNNEINDSNLNIKITGYVCYMEQCNMVISIKNNTNNEINLKDIMYLTNYENEQKYKLKNKDDDLTIKPNEEKNLELIFENDTTTPKNIIIEYENKNITVPVIKDYKNKN